MLRAHGWVGWVKQKWVVARSRNCYTRLYILNRIKVPSLMLHWCQNTLSNLLNLWRFIFTLDYGEQQTYEFRVRGWRTTESIHGLHGVGRGAKCMYSFVHFGWNSFSFVWTNHVWLYGLSLYLPHIVLHSFGVACTDKVACTEFIRISSWSSSRRNYNCIDN